MQSRHNIKMFKLEVGVPDNTACNLVLNVTVDFFSGALIYLFIAMTKYLTNNLERIYFGSWFEGAYNNGESMVVEVAHSCGGRSMRLLPYLRRPRNRGGGDGARTRARPVTTHSGLPVTHFLLRVPLPPQTVLLSGEQLLHYRNMLCTFCIQSITIEV